MKLRSSSLAILIRKERVKGYYKIPKPVVEKVDQDDEVVEDESE